MFVAIALVVAAPRLPWQAGQWEPQGGERETASVAQGVKKLPNGREL